MIGSGAEELSGPRPAIILAASGQGALGRRSVNEVPSAQPRAQFDDAAFAQRIKQRVMQLLDDAEGPSRPSLYYLLSQIGDDECVEYLRVAAQLIFEELDETRVRDDA